MMTSTRRVLLIATAAAGAIAGGPHVNSASAAINLELRPAAQSVFVASAFSVDLYAVSDSPLNQTLSAAQVILTWDTAYIQLAGIDNTGSPMSSSGFFPEPWGLNTSITDGDAMWIGFAPLGNPVAATPAGTFLTSFDFLALAPTAPTTPISIPLSGGNGGATIVFDGTTANTNVLGVAIGATITVAVPSPGVAAMLVVAAACGGTRRRRKACT